MTTTVAPSGAVSTTDLALLGLTLVGFTLGLVIVFGIVMLKAGRLPHPTSLVIALGMLAVLALVGYIESGAEVLGTIAGTAVGAIAGAVVGSYDRTRKDGDDESPTT